MKIAQLLVVVFFLLGEVCFTGCSALQPPPPTLTPSPTITPTLTRTSTPPHTPTATPSPIPTATLTRTPIPVTVVPVPESDIYPTRFEVVIQAGNLIVTWDPDDLRKYGVIAPFVFLMTGEKDADGKDKVMATNYGETVENKGTLTIEDIEPGQYILVMIGIITESFSDEQLSPFIRFEMP